MSSSKGRLKIPQVVLHGFMVRYASFFSSISEVCAAQITCSSKRVLNTCEWRYQPVGQRFAFEMLIVVKLKIQCSENSHFMQ